MAKTTVEFDQEILRQLLLPGVNVQIVGCTWASDAMRDSLVLELDGPDAPECERAKVLMRQALGPGQAVVLTATLNPDD